ncbi:hypothetical protein SASPL_104530 [Salvia splendens]|uniref:ABC transporter domain-containing protein n=1 Tax=Salvia splendens TaxID=180675 RepID=A0A8X8YI50_SALSN|nr:hypothetical protein SASPL_104530 [Salvia splendens]
MAMPFYFQARNHPIAIVLHQSCRHSLLLIRPFRKARLLRSDYCHWVAVYRLHWVESYLTALDGSFSIFSEDCRGRVHSSLLPDASDSFFTPKTLLGCSDVLLRIDLLRFSIPPFISLLGFDGQSSRATHQPLSSEVLWWDRYGSDSEGVRGRCPTAWDNPAQRVDDHAGRLAPTWETAWGRHEGGRYSDPPRRIDASKRRAAIAQPPPRPDPDPPDIGAAESSFDAGAGGSVNTAIRGDGDRGKQPSASVAIEGPSSSTTDLLLQVKDLSAVIAESKQPILKGVNLTVRYGEVHVVMGKNDSGKSTFAKVLAGHPDYEVTGGSVMYKGLDLREMEPEERATAGLFMSFQSSVEIPGVSNIDFLNMAYNARRRKLGLPELGPIEFYGCVAPKLELVNMKTDFLYRYVNEGFSGFAIDARLKFNCENSLSSSWFSQAPPSFTAPPPPAPDAVAAAPLPS